MTGKKEHPLAYLLRWIATGEEIQYYHGKKHIWADVSAEAVLKSLCNMPDEVATTKYRIKPNTIRIGKYDVAEPMKEEPAEGTRYYYLTTKTDTWYNQLSDKVVLNKGMAWINEEDALLAAKAIKEILTGQ